MNSTELTKLTGAVLVGGLVLLTSTILARNLVVSHSASEVAMAVPHGTEGEGQGATPEAPAGEALEPVSGLIASADLAAGAAGFAKCTSCHSIDKGGAKKVGPNLWGIVGGKHAHMADFGYSDALKAMADKPWGFEDLNAWLLSPKSYAPGTKMVFPGIKKAQDRANLIAWLNTQSDAPLPAPAAETSTEAATAATTTETAPAATETAPAATEPTPPAATTEQTATTGTEQPAAAASGEQTAAAGGGLAELLKAADPAAGQKVAAKCKACHSFEKDGGNKVGPNLWDIVGAKHAHKADYDYSPAMKGMADKDWSFEELDKFLAAPKDYVPGTKMTFAGIKKPEDRAALIAWLRSLSDAPKPLP